MRLLSNILRIYLLLSLILSCQTTNSKKPVTLVKEAYVFQDKKWNKMDFFIRDTVLSFKNNALISDTIDATDKYITPGFVEGHTHNLDRSWQHSLVDKYLSEGVLVVRNMTSKSRGTASFRKHLDTIPSPRVLYANWGFTSTLGHPFMAYEPYAIGLRSLEAFKANSKRLDTSRVDLYNSYAFVDSIRQLKNIWPKFLETNPDLVKIYYFNEDKIETRKKGAYGLRYEVAKAITDSAHAANLKVHAHIGTAQELEKMVDAGVDGFAHTPGFQWNGDSTQLKKYYLDDQLLQKSAEQNVILNPTAIFNLFNNKNDSIAVNQVATLQTDMIRRYRKMGGTIVPGLDMFASTSKKLFDYYANYINLPPEEKVSIFTEEATEALLPDVKTGKLKEGFEASFLIFDKQPFADNTWEKPEKVFLKGKKVK